ncbi:teichoic acid transport system permease protein [Candidatus Planktophila sulfonica]|uniref:Transport permease protein n=1 Tax=Candidatus Planktophila sulfonica TaxID=1884904 RepID=A0A249KHJ3_9ACTN|nr:ABC transporter permease [Candidatus Planktophila sulfonica]ASY16273.1 teichoic acid transport system permease protein [Candidatus Planktophila sulfonica]
MEKPVVVYEPFRAGLPPMREYMRSLWSRRTFISEFSRSELREQNYGSVFGQLWLVLNPLLLSAVYFLLIYVIGGSSDATRFGHLTASLFLFYLVANSLTGGVKAITSGQRLIMNTSFPRVMLPISATVIALFKFIPTLIVFGVIHVLIGLPYSWQMLWAIPIMAIALVMALGMAILISCINVYFRDISSMLPYLTRSLLYLSPILYVASSISDRIKTFEIANPIFYLLDSWSRVLVHAQAPTVFGMVHASVWALSLFTVGTYFFLSRERDFAVRL